MNNNKDLKNPFAITKAIDFTDEQIFQYWVDMNFAEIIAPTSRKPMIIKGGKGSGKTHVLRYFSYNVQKVRAQGNIFDSIKNDGYLGIYLLCNSLNAKRFSKKGISEDAWEVLFNYYFELEVAELFLRCVAEILVPQEGDRHIDKKDEVNIVAEIMSHFISHHKCESIYDIIKYIVAERKLVDAAVNNCVFTKKIKHEIQFSQGRLIFAIPAIFERYFLDKNRNEFNFVYIFDELENLTARQQMFIHTLYREKQGPCTFRIGVRLYGIKTTETYADGQENIDGAEYEGVCLDDRLREGEKEYKNFAIELLLKRLQGGGFQFNPSVECDKSRLIEMFGVSFSTRLSDAEKIKIRKKYHERNRLNPWIEQLKSNLTSLTQKSNSLGVRTKEDVSRIIRLVTFENDYYYEKLNCFFLYQCWSRGENLLEAATAINEAIGSEKRKYDENHFKSDMIAQIRRETDTKQLYTGLETFLTMTSGYPRYLLVLMKKIFDRAVFLDETPFENKTISLEAQKRGVQQTVDLFYIDATSIGEDDERVKQAMDRLGNLFRAIRFADKPSECALSTFSTSSSHPVLKKAVDYSLLIRKTPRRGKNAEIEETYQINPMIAPRWDLPTSRRGTFKLSAETLGIIFGEPSIEIDQKMSEYERQVKEKMSAPTFGEMDKKVVGNFLFSEEEEND